MNYYINAEEINLDELQKRITETDLVPSRRQLLENIAEKFKILKNSGYVTLADLRRDLKNAKKIPAISEETGIGLDYLTLLRREIEGYFPKTFPVKAFNWFTKADIEKFEQHGYKNNVVLFQTLGSSKKRKEISTELIIDTQIIDEIYSLVSLTRIQWVSPLAAKMLLSAGYTTVKSVANAAADELYDELDRVNVENKYFKGKIGLRDVKRLIKAASYVS